MCIWVDEAQKTKNFSANAPLSSCKICLHWALDQLKVVVLVVRRGATEYEIQ